MLESWGYAETTTEGTGNLTLSAVSGFPAISALFAIDEPFIYAILDAAGKPLEIGMGYLSASTTMVRHLVYATFVSGTYTDSGASSVSLAAGTKQVRIVPDGMNVAQNLPALAANATANSKYVLSAHAHMHTTSGGTWASAQDRIHYYPFYLAHKASINAVVVRVSAVAGSPNNTMDAGIYSVGSNGKPRARLAQVTAVTLTNGAINFLAFTALRLRPGWYYVALNTPSTANALRYSDSVGPSPLASGAASGELHPHTCVTEDATAGTLPATANAGDPRFDAFALPRMPTIALRRA